MVGTLNAGDRRIRLAQMALEGSAVVILLQSMSKHVKTNLTISFILL